MDLEFSAQPADLITVAAGAAMLGLGLWLLRVGKGRPVNRAFAAFMLMRGMSNLLSTVYRADAAGAGQYFSFGSAFDLVLLFPALHFGLHYRANERGEVAPRWATPALYGAAILVAAWWWIDPTIGLTYDELPAEGFRIGGLASITFPTYAFVLAAVALVLARDYTRLSDGPARTSALWMSFAFAAWPLYFAVGVVDSALIGGPFVPTNAADLSVRLVVWADVAVLLLVPVASLLVLRGTRDDGNPATGRDVRRYIVLLFIPPLSAAAVWHAGLAGLVAPGTAFALGNALNGIWLLVMPLIGVYALLRHQLFGVDVRIKRTIRQSTVAAIFIAVFFVASEGAQEAFSDRAGPLVGIIAAGALVFALAPLQRFADRVATAAMPSVRAVGDLTSTDRARIYRDQAAAAWSDGAIDKRERLMLDRLRDALGIAVEEAVRLEADAGRDA